jgi:hypothetical protein
VGSDYLPDCLHQPHQQQSPASPRSATSLCAQQRSHAGPPLLRLEKCATTIQPSITTLLVPYHLGATSKQTRVGSTRPSRGAWFPIQSPTAALRWRFGARHPSRRIRRAHRLYEGTGHIDRTLEAAPTRRKTSFLSLRTRAMSRLLLAMGARSRDICCTS